MAFAINTWLTYTLTRKICKIMKDAFIEIHKYYNIHIYHFDDWAKCLKVFTGAKQTIYFLYLSPRVCLFFILFSLIFILASIYRKITIIIPHILFFRCISRLLIAFLLKCGTACFWCCLRFFFTLLFLFLVCSCDRCHYHGGNDKINTL